MRTEISIGVMLPNDRGLIVAETPRTKNTLNTALPTTLPSAIAVSPSFAAIADTNNGEGDDRLTYSKSGCDV